jgi:hypothetical protein
LPFTVRASGERRPVELEQGVFKKKRPADRAAAPITGDQKRGAIVDSPLSARNWEEEDALQSDVAKSPRRWAYSLAERKADFASVLEPNHHRRNSRANLPPKHVEDPPLDGQTKRHDIQEAAAGRLVAAAHAAPDGTPDL